MSPFLRNVERRIEAERELRMAATPGRALPGQNAGHPVRGVLEVLHADIRRVTEANPSLTPAEVAKRCECSPVTVRRVQRLAGLYRAPQMDADGRWVMP